MAAPRPVPVPLPLEPPRVPAMLVQGSKFIRWDEDPPTCTLVTLRVDEDGFYLYWTGPSMEVELLDVCVIRDTRNGRYARVPRDPRAREALGFGEPGGHPMERLLTVVHGPDMVNISFLNFVAVQDDVAQLWCAELFRLATNILHRNACRNTALRKAHRKLTLQLNSEGRIPVRNILKMFSADKKRVETALESCGLSANRNDAIPPSEFPLETFSHFLTKLCARPDVDTVLLDIGAAGKPYVSLEQLRDFVNTRQRDPRLNEVLHPPLSPHSARLLVERYEPNRQFRDRDQLSVEGFGRFLGGEENSIVPPDTLGLHQDMKQPLPAYFINSSHNTYLTAGQLTGSSSVEMYRQVLLSGCRCIELDCWKGRPPDEEPFITHGFTMTTEIPFKEVIEAIAESAFKTSPYPVILSFENHVDSAKQQAKMADYCRSIFGEALLLQPLDKYPLQPGVPLPSPEELRGRILIKNKKRRPRPPPGAPPTNSAGAASADSAPQRRRPAEHGGHGDGGSADAPDAAVPPPTPNGDERPQKLGEPRKSIDREAESEEEEDEDPEIRKPTGEEGTASSEVGATEEMSTLVTYVEPVKFKSFAAATKRDKAFEMSSFVETKGLEQLTKSPLEFVQYNKRQLSRVYPKGTRVDSSNFQPQLFWNAGCQMAALNFQTLDVPMQLNLGLFEYNGRSGFLLKPEFMRRRDKTFDPFAEDIVDGVVANSLSVQVISGQFLGERRAGFYVEVDLFGLPVDTRRRFRTRTVQGNAFNPVWDEEPFVFSKVVLPSLATLRIAAYEEGGRFLGHRVLPVAALRSGYHYVSLRSESNVPLGLAALLVRTEASDYVPRGHLDYAEALINPIKHVSLMDQRTTRLAALMGDPEDNMERPPEPTVGVRNESGADPPGDPRNPITPGGVSGPPPPLPSPGQRDDLIASILTAVTPPVLEELRQHKALRKLRQKQSRELGELRRRHRQRMQRSASEAEGLRLLREEQQRAERGCLREHLRQAQQRLREVALEVQAAQLKLLRQTSEREKKELQKILERRRHRSITEARGRGGRRQTELTEINRRHITESVTSIRRLEEAQQRRQEKLLEGHRGPGPTLPVGRGRMISFCVMKLLCQTTRNESRYAKRFCGTLLSQTVQKGVFPPFWMAVPDPRKTNVLVFTQPFCTAEKSRKDPKRKAAFGSVGRRIPYRILHVINQDGESLGDMHRAEALRLMDEHDLKLVLLRENAEPPVYRLMTGQQIHEEKLKRAEKEKASSKTVLVQKELSFSSAIAKNDLETKIKQITHWIEKKYHVKVTIRQAKDSNTDTFTLFDQILETMSDKATYLSKPKAIKEGTSMCILRHISDKELKAHQKMEKQKNSTVKKDENEEPKSSELC